MTSDEFFETVEKARDAVERRESEQEAEDRRYRVRPEKLARIERELRADVRALVRSGRRFNMNCGASFSRAENEWQTTGCSTCLVGPTSSIDSPGAWKETWTTARRSRRWRPVRPSWVSDIYLSHIHSEDMRDIAAQTNRQAVALGHRVAAYARQYQREHRVRRTARRAPGR